MCRTGFLFCLILIGCSCDNIEKNCETLIEDSDTGGTFKWNASASGQIVISDPPCMDEKGRLIEKVCIDGRWIPPEKPVCFNRIQKRTCPDKYLEIDKYCIQITEPIEWGDYRCAIVENTREIIELYNVSVPVWMPIRKKIKFGQYEYVVPNEKYGKEFEDQYLYGSLYDEANETEKYCAVFEKSIVRQEDCSAKHPHICTYQVNSYFQRCPDDCVNAESIPNMCYCKIKDRPCKNLAKITYQRDKQILQELAGDDLCLVDDSHSLVQQQNLFPAINETHWIFQPSKSLHCSLCETRTLENPIPELVLNFEGKYNELFLSVYNPQSLLKDKKDSYSIYCFTDAAAELKKPVQIEQLWNSDDLVHYKLQLEEYIGRYWCEAFQLQSHNLMKSNEIIAYRKKKGNEYAIRLLVDEICANFDVCFDYAFKLPESVANFTEKTVFRHHNVKVRAMEVIDFQNEGNFSVDILLHVSSKRKRHVMAEYNMFLEVVLNSLPSYAKLVYFRSAEVCLAQNTFSVDTVLNWNVSQIGESAVPKEVCLQSDGLPVWRVCGGSFLYGSEWSNPSGACSKDVKVSEKTQKLHDIYVLDDFANITSNLTIATENTADLNSLDLYYLTKILYKIGENDSNNIDDVTKIIDNVMNVDRNVMVSSQMALNLTDDLLDVIERQSYKNLDVHLNNYLIKTNRHFEDNLTGIAIYGDPNTSFADLTIKNINPVDGMHNLDTNNLLLATYVPAQNFESSSPLNNVSVVVTIFDKDVLFVSNTGDKVSSKVLSIDLQGLIGVLKEPIPIYFKSLEEDEDSKCAFWDYGKKTKRHKGRWSTLGGNYLGSVPNTSLKMCSFAHLTHFALLISNEKIVANGDETITQKTYDEYDTVFDIVTKIGSFLSLLGITGIFLTAMMFEKWRQKTGTKILLQLSLAILIEIILTQVTNINLQEDADFCVILGAILQYAVLSKFGWMLVYAFLQYFRFVTVMGSMPKRIIMKGTIVGWGLPLIPVVVSSVSRPEDYAPGVRDYCYPRNLSFYLGVLLPVLVFVIINLFVFVKIMYEILHRKVEVRTSHSLQKRQLYLAILLFFVLGVPWAFGILGTILDGTDLSDLFTLLFCLTAPLQGFVLFIFYVILNDETRFKWVFVIKNTLIKQG